MLSRASTCTLRTAQRMMASPAIRSAMRLQSTHPLADRPAPTDRPTASLFAEPLTVAQKHWMPHPIYTEEQLDAVKITHLPPDNMVAKVAYYAVKATRTGFDLVSGYTLGKYRGTLKEDQWLKRILFLETVAGVPGMMAGMVRHAKSLRTMRRDYGWIHTLLEEAENERMHLMCALELRQPGIIFRMAVVAAQAIFVVGFTVAYIMSPQFCHRFVGYLEEEAVKTYTQVLEYLDQGNLVEWGSKAAPELAVEYWRLPKDASVRDMLRAMRADESHHRDVNHTFADMTVNNPYGRNPFAPGA